GLRRRALNPRLEALPQLLQLGRDDSQAVGVLLAFAGPIILVIILRRIPFGLGLDGGDDRLVLFLLRPFDGGARLGFLALVLREDGRAILRADVAALPVELGRVVRREENIEQ